MKIRPVVAAVVLAAGLFVTAPSAAADPDPKLPTCANITSVDCTSTVTNRVRFGYFCQQLDDGPMRCEFYWPFRNPTAYEHTAVDDPGAFPADYLPTKARAKRLNGRVDALRAKVARKDARIERLRDRLH